MTPELESIRNSPAFKRGQEKAAAETAALLPSESPEQITHRFRVAAENVETAWRTLVEVAVHAYQSRTWAGMGYSTWDQYCRDEIGAKDLPKTLREQVVFELRQEGMSLRAIAATTGTSVGQAHADAGVQSLNTSEIVDAEIIEDPPRVTGLDGKDYPKAETMPDGRPAGAPASSSQTSSLVALIANAPESVRQSLRDEMDRRYQKGWAVTIRNGQAYRALAMLQSRIAEAEAALKMSGAPSSHRGATGSEGNGTGSSPAPSPEVERGSGSLPPPTPAPSNDRSDIPRGPRPPKAKKLPTKDEHRAPRLATIAHLRAALEAANEGGGLHAWDESLLCFTMAEQADHRALLDEVYEFFGRARLMYPEVQS